MQHHFEHSKKSFYIASSEISPICSGAWKSSVAFYSIYANYSNQ